MRILFLAFFACMTITGCSLSDKYGSNETEILDLRYFIDPDGRCRETATGRFAKKENCSR